MNEKDSLGIYVHIPFCVKKCNYCDFLSAPASTQVRKRYIEALLEQIKCCASLVKEYEVKTVYFGGGTPSLLEAEEIGRIFGKIKEEFELSEESLKEMEITLEANPGTFGKDKLLAYKELGFNRLSIGVQSMNPEELKLLGRVHRVEDFLENYKLAREWGFENINVDLMEALPGQTVKGWEQTLKQVISLQPEHISAYSLIIEEGTKFYEWYAGKEELLPDEDEEREIYYRTEEVLRDAGYERYEISNYAKPGKESRHNLSYWQGTDYLGLGLGASSLIKGERFSNVTSLDAFAVAAGKVSRHLEEFVGERTVLTKQDKMEEFMFLGLRVMKGVSKQEFFRRFQVSMEAVYGEALKKLETQGLVQIDGDRVFLTKMGIDVSNYVFTEFLLD